MDLDIRPFVAISGGLGVSIGWMPTCRWRITEKIKGFATVSPRLAWHGNGVMTVELVAENLWPYHDSAVQRMDASYVLSVKVNY